MVVDGQLGSVWLSVTSTNVVVEPLVPFDGCLPVVRLKDLLFNVGVTTPCEPKRDKVKLSNFVNRSISNTYNFFKQVKTKKIIRKNLSG